MKITLLGAIGFLAVAVLLIYAGSELNRVSEEKKKTQPNTNPKPPLNP